MGLDKISLLCYHSCMKKLTIQEVARRITKKYFENEDAEHKKFEDIMMRAGDPFEYGMRSREQVLIDTVTAILEEIDVVSDKPKCR